MSPRARVLVAALACGAVAIAGCSSRGEDASGGNSSTEATTAVTTTSDDAFGTLATPCGEGEGDSTSTSAAPAADEVQGIEDDAILVGTVADPGFSGRPGINQEIFDAGQAFVGWCNDQG